MPARLPGLVVQWSGRPVDRWSSGLSSAPVVRKTAGPAVQLWWSGAAVVVVVVIVVVEVHPNMLIQDEILHV